MNHVIEIKVDANGNFWYSAALLRVRANDTVQWQCLTGEFAVMFKTTSPFEQGMEAFGISGAFSSPLVVHHNAKGQFSYAVAVFTGGRIFIDCSCPVLVAN